MGISCAFHAFLWRIFKYTFLKYWRQGQSPSPVPFPGSWGLDIFLWQRLERLYLYVYRVIKLKVVRYKSPSKSMGSRLGIWKRRNKDTLLAHSEGTLGSDREWDHLQNTQVSLKSSTFLIWLKWRHCLFSHCYFDLFEYATAASISKKCSKYRFLEIQNPLY